MVIKVLLIFLGIVLMFITPLQAKGRFHNLGKLQVDTAFYKAYFNDFRIPYEQFEDLHTCRIKIISKPLKTTMAARPSFLSLLWGKSSRRYIVFVNTKKDFDGVLLNDVPKTARIGLFAHELMHLRDYETKGVWGVIKRGFQYLSVSGKTKVEHYTDRLTIASGFGKELFSWSHFVLNGSTASDEYKAFKSKVYLSPDVILDEISNCN